MGEFSDTDSLGGSVGGSGGYSDDTVGDTSGTYSGGSSYGSADPGGDFSIGLDPSLSRNAIDSIGRGLTDEEKGFFGMGYNVQDFGRSASNISNASNYDPMFAALSKMSRGLDPRGVKDLDKTTFGRGILSTNPIASIDPKSALGQKYSQALAMAPNIMGPFSKDALQGLSLAQIDKMDPAGLASLMAAQNMSATNPYGATTGPGYAGAIASLAGLTKGPQDISFSMSPRDAIQTARSGLAYGASGRDMSNFGNLGAISDKFSRDMSNISMEKIGQDFSRAGQGIADLARSAFAEAKDAVQDALGFATNPYGGVTDKDFSGLMSSRDDKSSGSMQISDMTQQGADMEDVNKGIGSLGSDMMMADASSFFSPQTISQGLNYLAGPQIQDYFRDLTGNPDTTIKLGPRFDIEKQKLDDNIITIDVPLRDFGIG